MPSFLQKLVTAIFSLIGLALFLGFLWKLLPGKGEKHEAVVAEQFTHHEGTHEEHPEGSTEAPTPRMIPAPNPVPPPKPPDPVVVIDAGHGGIDGGTKGFGQQEKLLTLEIAKELAAELKRRGIPHVMTRTEDKAISLDQRCAFANSAPRLAFVSVHLNWGRPSSVNGIETFYTEEKSVDAQLWTRRHLKIPDGSRMDDGRGAALARMIQDSASTSTGAKNRGVKEYKYAVTRRVRCPSVLIECGFLSNQTECSNITMRAYRQKLAKGIADGLEKFLKLSAADPLYAVNVVPNSPGATDEAEALVNLDPPSSESPGAAAGE